VTLQAINYDGDVYSDLLLSADGASTVAGRVLVYAGPGVRSGQLNAVDVKLTINGNTGTDNFSGAGIGDVNGDGLTDVMVTDPNTGQAYLFITRTPTVAATYSLSQADLTLPAFAQGPGTGAYRLGDIGGASATTGQPGTKADGYGDFAVVQNVPGTTVASQVQVYLGGAVLSIVPAVTITNVGPTSLYGFFLSETLTPVAGDFDGDGRGDLAILDSTSLSNAGQLTPIASQVYVFWHVADHGPTLTLANADAVIDSTVDSGFITSISGGMGQDLNGDHIDDLLVGAANATGSVGTVKQGAGREYVVYGSRHGGTLPSDHVTVLSNFTVTGAGDYVTDPGTGQPVVFDENLNSASAGQGPVVSLHNPGRWPARQLPGAGPHPRHAVQRQRPVGGDVQQRPPAARPARTQACPAWEALRPAKRSWNSTSLPPCRCWTTWPRSRPRH